MVCPKCNVQMNHLNKGDGFSTETSYQTYDYMECPSCKQKAIEFYHTEFIDSINEKPDFSISLNRLQ